MRVSNRNTYETMNRRLSTITEEMREINERVSSGKRINRPSDDPIGITQALRLKKSLSQIGQYGRNIQVGQSWLNQADASLQRVETLVLRAKEIANQMATGTYSESQRKSSAEEVVNLIGSAIEVGNTQLAGRYIFGGYQDGRSPFGESLAVQAADAAPGNNAAYTGTAASSGAFTGLYSKKYVVEMTTGGAVGAASYKVSEDGGATWGPDDAFITSTSGTGVWNSTDQGVQVAFTDSGSLAPGDRFVIDVGRYRGDGEDVKIATGSATRVKINLNGAEIFGEAGDGETNLFDILTGLQDGLQNNRTDQVQSSLEDLNSFQNQLGGNLADVGSRLNRLEMNQNLLSDLDMNHTGRLSEVEDADAVKAITDLNAKQQIYQAALYSASQISSLSLLDFLK
jgi:flagellar hook-associated protein 3 FlgL